MAVDRLRFTISDMNGAQNLYVLDGGRSRPDYLAAERAYVAALAAAERLVDAPADRALLGRVRRNGAAFRRVDDEIYADVVTGQRVRAAALVAGVETDNARAMDAAVSALLRNVTVRRESALRRLYDRETLVLLGLAGLGLIALVLSRWVIRERERTGTQLDRQREQYATLIEHLPTITFRSDRSGVISYVSPQMLTLLGYAPADFVGRRVIDAWQQFVLPDDAAVVGQWRRSHHADQPYAGSFRVRRHDGSVAWVAAEVAIIRDTDGRVDGRQGVIRDITHEVEAERRSREALSALVTATEVEQARIAGELHDDTVQVMTALLMTLRLVMGEDERLRRFERLLADALERTRRLMFELRPQMLERDGLGPAIAELAEDGPWQRAQVDIDLPRQSDTAEALVYRTVRELIVNARKHSRATELRVQGRAEGDEVVFDVEDDGVGFDVERARDRDRMRMHLGLDTSAERVRIAGGRLAIESEPGHGARFQLRLPAEPRSEADAGVERLDHDAAAGVLGAHRRVIQDDRLRPAPARAAARGGRR